MLIEFVLREKGKKKYLVNLLCSSFVSMRFSLVLSFSCSRSFSVSSIIASLCGGGGGTGGGDGIWGNDGIVAVVGGTCVL